MSDEDRKQSQTIPKFSEKEKETLVKCPVCKIGLVSPEIAVKISELMQCLHDGPNAIEK